jgi:RimJ/RimL family protein N-acetyltransferase
MTEPISGIDDQPPIIAGSLVLRPVAIDDAPALDRIQQDPAVHHGLGREAPPLPGIAPSDIPAIRAQWGSGPRPKFMFVICLKAEVIGFCDIVLGVADGGNLVGELTVVIDQSNRGDGYARTSLQALISWSFEHLPLMAEVWGSCVEDNVASIRLMSSIGMESAGMVTSREGRPVWKYRLSRSSSTNRD